MESTSCIICHKTFSRSDNLKRHMNSIHPGYYKNDSPPPPPPQSTPPPPPPPQFTPPPPPPQRTSEFRFHHPFTMLSIAPTGGGKTYMIKKLLENRFRFIDPPPQRIIWLYGQWQPLYEDMKKSITGIEFVRGIPWNIEEDSFLDPRVQNLIVIDDLMSQATQDTRICDLFTKGSHHRNLSVICLMQNLYYRGKENRTMNLNSHYLVLYKNPRDQCQVMTLARQMYPRNTQHFMDSYKAATNKPYGYLVIDLKPNTNEEQRLQANVLENAYTDHKSTEIIDDIHLKSDDREVNTPGVISLPTSETQIEEMESGNYSCDECGVLFNNPHDLQKHVRTWCPEQPPFKRYRFDDHTDEMRREKLQTPNMITPSESDEEREDDDSGFEPYINLVKDETNDIFQNKIKKYVAKNVSPKTAKNRARIDMLSYNCNLLMKKYQDALSSIIDLRKSRLHRSIMKEVLKGIEAGLYQENVIKRVVRKNRLDIMNLLEESEGEESETEEEESDGESSYRNSKREPQASLDIATSLNHAHTQEA